jgi:ribosomal protein S18 acetylase RimI-like enzyme
VIRSIPAHVAAAALRPATICTSARTHNVAMDVGSLYPDFDVWFHRKVMPGLRKGTRLLLADQVDDRVLGIAIAKREEEKKLCTLWVSPEARGLGIGPALAEEAFEWIGSYRPLFTVPQERMPEFKNLINCLGFCQAQKLVGYYRPGIAEYVFNGLLQFPS